MEEKTIFVGLGFRESWFGDCCLAGHESSIGLVLGFEVEEKSES